MFFARKLENFQFKRRKRRKRAEESDNHGKTQISAYIEFAGKKREQKAYEKRAGNIDKKCRERKLFKQIGERRNVD